MRCSECGDYGRLECGFCSFCWRELKHWKKQLYRKVANNEPLSELDRERLRELLDDNEARQ